MKEQFNEDDYKFLRNSLLWIKAHPEKNMKFNKKLKPLRRDIFNNLKVNILQENGRSIDFDAFKSYFWAYFEKNKTIPNSDVFKNISVNIPQGTTMTLYNYLKILEIIRSHTYSSILRIQESKKMFFVEDAQPIYSPGENSLNIDNQMTSYNDFLHNGLLQYMQSFENGLFELKNIIYSYVLKNKFRNGDFYDFSESGDIIYEDGVAINLSVFSIIIDALGISDNVDISKKL